MSDLALAAGVASASSPNSVELIANNSGLLAPVKVALIAGQNLPRGALLGRITLSAKYTLCVASVSDGSEVPTAVLVHDTDASAGDVEALVYERGDFNVAAITFGAGHSMGTAFGPLAAKKIYLHKPYGVAA